MRVPGVINRRYLKHRFDLYACCKRIVILGARRVLFRGPACYTRGFVLNVAAISIHAPRVGSDWVDGSSVYATTISIHAPRVGSDGPSRGREPRPRRFQSTLPVWGATLPPPGAGGIAEHFNPRSPCGERHGRLRCRPPGAGDFNPRSPCGERRHAMGRWVRAQHFNPRSPCGERLDFPVSDSSNRYFNPRSPCGERPAPGIATGVP